MNWEAKYVGECGCGECGGHWNVFKDDGTQIPKQSEEHAKLIAAAPRMKDALRKMYDAFWGTSESDGQDEANDVAKALLDELDA